LQTFDIFQLQAEINDLEFVFELVAARIPLEGSGNAETALVKVVQNKQRNAVPAANFVGEMPRRRHRYPFEGHCADVKAIGEVDRFPQRIEAFLLNVQQAAIAALRTARSNGARPEAWLHEAEIRSSAEVFPDR